MGFPWRLCAVLLHGTVFYRVQTWRAQLLGWFELVLLAEEVLPFTCAGAREKRNGLADPASSQEAEPDGNWPLVCLAGFLSCVSVPPSTSLCGSNTCTSTKGRQEWDGRGGNASSGSNTSLKGL